MQELLSTVNCWTDWLRWGFQSTLHRMGRFRDVLLGYLLKKLSPTQQEQHSNDLGWTKKHHGRIHSLTSGRDESWRARGTRHRGGGCGERKGNPSPLCEGFWRGLPLPIIFFRFSLKMTSFGAFWEPVLLQLNCLSYTHKPAVADTEGAGVHPPPTSPCIQAHNISSHKELNVANAYNTMWFECTKVLKLRTVTKTAKMQNIWENTNGNIFYHTDAIG